MFVLAAIVNVVLAAGFIGGSVAKLTRRKDVIEGIEHVGAGNLVLPIGVLEGLGAVGVLIGLAFAPLGVAAAVGLALLTGTAVVFHLRVGDSISGFGPALGLCALSIVAAVLRMLSA